MDETEPKTEQEKPIAERIAALDAEIEQECARLGISKPRTRGECEDGVRPCPWVRCRYHLLDVDPDSKSGRPTNTWVDPHEMPETCALDIAQKENHLDEIGVFLGVTKERVRQLEFFSLEKLSKRKCAKDAADCTTHMDSDYIKRNPNLMIGYYAQKVRKAHNDAKRKARLRLAAKKDKESETTNGGTQK